MDLEKLISNAALQNKLICPYGFMLYIWTSPFHRELGCEDIERTYLVEDMASDGLL